VAYVFDLLAGPTELRGVTAQLKELLEDARVLKVLHDGRQVPTAQLGSHCIRPHPRCACLLHVHGWQHASAMTGAPLCRLQDAAALFYQHGIRMAGVFDTQARTK